MLASAGARADDAKYPDWSGQWRRPGMALQWDTTKPMGRGQQAPLTPEYQALFEANLRAQAIGAKGNDTRYNCLPQGMPRMMSALFPMEFVIEPKTTYVLFENHLPRRIYTDGREWPKEELEPTFVGYSIGRWIDEDGDGRYDVLEAETRNIRGPRAFEPSGLPFHADNATIVKERLFLDKADRNVLHDEITTIDHALTRPWTVMQTFRREVKEIWVDNTVCRKQPPRHPGRGALLHQRRWPSDAGAEGPAAARPEILPAATTAMSGGNAAGNKLLTLVVVSHPLQHLLFVKLDIPRY
jgi:hypothetical protein